MGKLVLGKQEVLHVCVGLVIALSSRWLFAAATPELTPFGAVSLAAGIDVIAALVLGYPAALVIGLGSIPWVDPALAADALPGAIGGVLGLMLSLGVFRRFIGADKVRSGRYGVGEVVGFAALYAAITTAMTALLLLTFGRLLSPLDFAVAVAASFTGALALILALNVAALAALHLIRAL